MTMPHARECECRICAGKCKARLYSGALCHRKAVWRIGEDARFAACDWHARGRFEGLPVKMERIG